jgi:hypothetical protein
MKRNRESQLLDRMRRRLRGLRAGAHRADDSAQTSTQTPGLAQVFVDGGAILVVASVDVDVVVDQIVVATWT